MASMKHEAAINRLNKEMEQVLSTLQEIQERLNAMKQPPKKVKNGTK